MFVVGFDLDMTLVDSRPGIRASFAALTADTGVAVDANVVVARLGPKLESELAHWFAPEDVDRAAEIYRHHYALECRTGTFALPGATEVFDAVHARGGRAIVVTAKPAPLAAMCLDTVGLHADGVAGHVHGAEKGDALRGYGAVAYVGDTVPDIEAAHTASCVAIGITTGTDDDETLRAAGARHIVTDLFGVITLLDELVAGSGGTSGGGSGGTSGGGVQAPRW